MNALVPFTAIAKQDAARATLGGYVAIYGIEHGMKQNKCWGIPEIFNCHSELLVKCNPEEMLGKIIMFLTY